MIQKLVVVLITAMMLFGCKEEEATTVDPPKETVTRLFVSNTGSRRVDVYDITTDTVQTLSRSINTDLTEGVWVDAGKNMMIHAGSKSTTGKATPTIKFYSNASTVTGSAIPSSSFTDTVSLTNTREISYDAKNDILYVSNSTRKELLVYTSASTLTGNVSASRIIPLPGESWGIFLDDVNGRLFVAMDSGSDSVFVITTPITTENFSALDKKTLRLVTTGTRAAGTLRLHGMWYSSKLDVLYVTDVGNATPGLNDGSVYVIEQLNTVLSGPLSSPIIPTRTISGINSGLFNPTDIDADDRNGKETIYVCEKAGRKILLFPQTANGNVAASRTISFSAPDQPEDIFLDIKTLK